jgi:hypothetical protein
MVHTAIDISHAGGARATLEAMRTILAISLLVIGCGSEPRIDAGRPDAGPRCAPVGLPSPLVCNGHAELCDRAYDAVSYPMTHNAMSNDDERWLAPNQTHSMWRQLEDGVRGMMLDVHEDEGETMLCHAACGLGRRPLVDALRELRMFMDCHPGDVITIIFEAHVEEARIAAAFEDAGLLGYVHEQPLGAPWPTLREMVTSERRLVIFTESSEVTLPWYHYAYAYAWDNDYANETPDDFDCAPNRGTADNSIFVLNHFLTSPIALPSLAEMVNHNPLFVDRARQCQSETGQLPNFPTVDFYEIGDLFEVVDTLNGF